MPAAYVRESSHENDDRPWQVRYNRPDQTFEVLVRYETQEQAETALLPVPKGVEILLDNTDLDARLRIVRRESDGTISEELRRLVSEESRRGLAAAGITV